MIFLTIDHICQINFEWIRDYGGRYQAVDYNLCNRASLEYILEAIQYTVFGIDLFPTLVEKAAALAWWIIEGHVFNDGNKRTGMESAIELLQLNGAKTHFDIKSIVDISEAVANRELNIEELVRYFSENVELG